MKVENQANTAQTKEAIPEDRARRRRRRTKPDLLKFEDGVALKHSSSREAKVDSRSSNQIQKEFAEQFRSLAKDPAGFHKMMKEVYGEGYSKGRAESFRKKALAGDFSWMPKIKFVDSKSLGGAQGAYDSKSETVFLNRALQKNPLEAIKTYREEVGHHLDKKLNKRDTRGDEGEMFGRLMGGENLSHAEKARIRSENDKGTIKVDGKEVNVEFRGRSDRKARRSERKETRKSRRADRKEGRKARRSKRKARRKRRRVRIKNAFKSFGKALGGALKSVAMFPYKVIRGTVDSLINMGKAWKNGNVKEGFKQLGMAFGSPVINAIGTTVDVALQMGAGIGSFFGQISGREKDITDTVMTREMQHQLGDIYRGSVNLGRVQIKRGGLIAKGSARTVGNTIYFPEKSSKGIPYFNEDGSLSDAGKKTFFHEMSHIWQNQNEGAGYISESLWEQTLSKVQSGKRNGAYQYKDDALAGKDFKEMNPEQQGNIIRDISLLMANGEKLVADQKVGNYSAEEVNFFIRSLADIRAGNTGG